jgi:hypothetical protein
MRRHNTDAQVDYFLTAAHTAGGGWRIQADEAVIREMEKVAEAEGCVA